MNLNKENIILCRPRISVCIATYNGEKYIRKQIGSILSQLSDYDEIIISDDFSNDNTIAILEEYKDDRIKIFYNKKSSSNIAYNFENSLSKANGDYVFLSDQDDVWYSNKVDTMLRFLQLYDLVVSDCVVTDFELKPLINSFFSHRNSGPGFYKNLYKNSFIGCCMAFRIELLKTALPFPANLPPYAHDWWIGLVAERTGTTYFCKDKLIMYVRHGKNSSSTSEKGFPYKIKILNRYNLIISISKRILFGR